MGSWNKWGQSKIKINGVKNKWGQSKVAVRLSAIAVRLRQTRSGACSQAEPGNEHRSEFALSLTASLLWPHLFSSDPIYFSLTPFILILLWPHLFFGNVFLAAMPPVQFVGGRAGRATSENVPRQSLGTSTGASLRLAWRLLYSDPIYFTLTPIISIPFIIILLWPHLF